MADEPKRSRWKTTCRVDGRFDGLIDIVTQDYDKAFRVWYGAIDLTCSSEETPFNRSVPVILEDGHEFAAFLYGGFSEECSVQHGDMEVGRHILSYFVALTPVESMDNALERARRGMEK